MSHSGRRIAATVTAALTLAGCGTTVHGVTASQGSAAAGGGLTAPTSTAPGSQDSGDLPGPGGSLTGPAGPVAGAGTSAAPGTVGSAGPGAGAGGTAVATGNALPPTGRGYDEKHVYLGFPTNTDVSKAAPAGLGASNFGDQEAQIKAVVADANKHGGLLGRTIVPLFHDMTTANLQADPQNQAQATCAAFTEDDTVVAVINIVAAIDLETFYSCLAKHETPLISAGFIPADDELFSTYAPFLYKTTAASFTALGPVWLDRLSRLGYFHGWDAANGRPAGGQAKVGLLYPNRQPQQRIFAQLKSQLGQRGIDVAKDFQYDASSLDRESADMSNAVLQFRNAGVTHVLSSESDVLLFMSAADGQHYRPRYGLNSYHAAGVQLQGTVPDSQLVGSMGVGWLPVSDVDHAHNPGPVGPGERHCRKVMSDANQDISSAAPAIVALALCDGVRMVVGGVTAAGNPAAAALRSGLARIGATFPSALTWRSALAARYDLPGAVRDFRYDKGAYHYLSDRNRPF